MVDLGIVITQHISFYVGEFSFYDVYWIILKFALSLGYMPGYSECRILNLALLRSCRLCNTLCTLTRKVTTKRFWGGRSKQTNTFS